MTLVAAVIVTTQAPVPVQPPPDQPVNVELAAALAVSCTIWSWLKLADWLEQAAPQLIPTGLDVTVPVPVPPLFRVSR